MINNKHHARLKLNQSKNNQEKDMVGFSSAVINRSRGCQQYFQVFYLPLTVFTGTRYDTMVEWEHAHRKIGDEKQLRNH